LQVPDPAGAARSLLVLSSDAISAHPGHRSPRESKRRSPAEVVPFVVEVR
jgi:hypothetical protein